MSIKKLKNGKAADKKEVTGEVIKNGKELAIGIEIV